MKTHQAIEKMKSDNIDDREEGAWELYITAMHCFKTLEFYTKNEKDRKLKFLLDTMIYDFKALYDKENS
jgi:hypothetical protein